LGVMAVVLAAAPLTSGPGQASSAPLWPSTVPALAVPASTGPPASPGPASTGQAGQGPRWQQIILPDLAVIAPHGLSVADIGKLRKVHGARDVLAVDGAAIEVRGRPVNVIGVDPQQFRSWTPLATASDTRLWEAIAGGYFVSAASARHLLRLHSGTRYQLAGASRVTLTYGGAAAFGIAGVDLVVGTGASASLGLIHNVAALVSAPGVAMPALKHEVRAALGGAGRVVSLREPQLPVGTSASGGKPATYLQLFRESAARY